MEFSFKEILEILLRRFVLIAIFTFGGICIFFVYSKFIVNPTYEASVQMYVNSNDTTYTADLSELNYAQKVVTTYINFLQTKVFYQQVVDESKLNYTSTQLKNMTNINAIDNTEIFEISVSSQNPSDAYELVLAAQKIAPVLIKSIKESAQISVVDPPGLPTAPSSPNIPVNTLTGGMIGFVLSIMISLLLEIFDTKVKNQDDLSKRYHIPILGTIPNFNVNIKRKNEIFSSLQIQNFKLWKKIVTFLAKAGRKNGGKIEPKKVVFADVMQKKVMQNDFNKNKNKNTEFAITEAYKSLRSNLNFTLRFDGCKKIVISSSVPEDGKSTTVTNIGISIAQAGIKVLLLDCDLRKGRLHRLFNIQFRPGISDVLSSTMDVKKAIYKTSYENLFVMPTGTIPPNPSELLASIQMEELLNKLCNEYEYIIIDTPPVKVVSDALNLVKIVDGVLIVVREGVTSHPCVATAVEKYQFLNANILGFVLNGISLDPREKSRYRYYN